ncbi:MAG: Two-component transcriptional response regulator, LuxR family [Cytophagales bacterium]|jgi:DNA-binding response OmpR family regulator|nr:response regulator transcription factor [Bacteroidota bacterium]MBS1980820.1 response regulator transcription factor [Bacteroidota bacterium]WHZ08165.1 MAG: Two-component transcriptional response regulator, LuxR family [Cytophagales bacterium]
MKILLVEDEKSLAESIMEYLTGADYRCEVAYDFDSACEKILLYEYDCILLDLTLPGGNGLHLLKELKQRKKQSGVIIISAKNSLDDKIKGLDIGADDYLPKPFHLAELGARVNALIRRNKFEGETELVFGPLRLDVAGKVAFVNQNKMELTKSEFDLLLFLVSNKNKVVSKNAIGEHLSGDEADRFDNFDFVYSHIKNIKRKLSESGGGDYIKTIYGLGYKFEL